jgi:hypothetical protein
MIHRSWHTVASLSLMALEAFVTDGVFGPIPAQNNFIPPPVPVDSTNRSAELGLLGESLSHHCGEWIHR